MVADAILSTDRSPNKMWRNQLRDVALLYSLVDDLQLFWQYKALEWGKLARKIAQAAEEEQRTLARAPASPEKRLAEILEHNEDYHPLRNRIQVQLNDSLQVADFLGFGQVASLQQLSFEVPLPDDDVLEAAIAEAEQLARYAERANYWWHAIAVLWLRLWHSLRTKMRPPNSSSHRS